MKKYLLIILIIISKSYAIHIKKLDLKNNGLYYKKNKLFSGEVSIDRLWPIFSNDNITIKRKKLKKIKFLINNGKKHGEWIEYSKNAIFEVSVIYNNGFRKVRQISMNYEQQKGEKYFISNNILKNVNLIHEINLLLPNISELFALRSIQLLQNSLSTNTPLTKNNNYGDLFENSHLNMKFLNALENINQSNSIILSLIVNKKNKKIQPNFDDPNYPNWRNIPFRFTMDSTSDHDYRDHRLFYNVNSEIFGFDKNVILEYEFGKIHTVDIGDYLRYSYDYLSFFDGYQNFSQSNSISWKSRYRPISDQTPIHPYRFPIDNFGNHYKLFIDWNESFYLDPNAKIKKYPEENIFITPNFFKLNIMRTNAVEVDNSRWSKTRDFQYTAKYVDTTNYVLNDNLFFESKQRGITKDYIAKFVYTQDYGHQMQDFSGVMKAKEISRDYKMIVDSVAFIKDVLMTKCDIHNPYDGFAIKIVDTDKVQIKKNDTITFKEKGEILWEYIENDSIISILATDEKNQDFNIIKHKGTDEYDIHTNEKLIRYMFGNSIDADVYNFANMNKNIPEGIFLFKDPYRGEKFSVKFKNSDIIGNIELDDPTITLKGIFNSKGFSGHYSGNAEELRGKEYLKGKFKNNLLVEFDSYLPSLGHCEVQIKKDGFYVKQFYSKGDKKLSIYREGLHSSVALQKATEDAYGDITIVDLGESILSQGYHTFYRKNGTKEFSLFFDTGGKPSDEKSICFDEYEGVIPCKTKQTFIKNDRSGNLLGNAFINTYMTEFKDGPNIYWYHAYPNLYYYQKVIVEKVLSREAMIKKVHEYLDRFTKKFFNNNISLQLTNVYQGRAD